VPTASPARTSLARLRTGPSSKPSSAPPLAGASRRSSSRVGRPLRRRPVRRRSARRRRLLRRAPSSPSRGTHPARGPRPPVRGHHRPDTPSLGAFSLICVPSTPPGRCRQHRFMRASPLRRVVAVGPCVYRVLYVSYVRRGVTVRDNGICGLKSAINTISFRITRFRALHSLLHTHYTLHYTPSHYTPHYTPNGCVIGGVTHYTTKRV
jgi:hypothetical protein